jgi:hypothetical protein
MPQFPSYKDYQVYKVASGDRMHTEGSAVGWYFDEGGQCLGPYPTEAIARRICALRRSDAEMAARSNEIEKLPHVGRMSEMEKAIKWLRLTEDEARRVRERRAEFLEGLKDVEPKLPKGAKAVRLGADAAARLSRKLLLDFAIDAVKALPSELRKEFEKILPTIEPPDAISPAPSPEIPSARPDALGG